MKTEKEIRQRILEKQKDLDRAIRRWQMKKSCTLRGASIDRIETEIDALNWALKGDSQDDLNMHVEMGKAAEMIHRLAKSNDDYIAAEYFKSLSL